MRRIVKNERRRSKDIRATELYFFSTRTRVKGTVDSVGKKRDGNRRFEERSQEISVIKVKEKKLTRIKIRCFRKGGREVILTETDVPVTGWTMI